MIWSVSMFGCGSGMAIDSSVVKRCMAQSCPHVGELPGDGGRGRHRRAHQMGARAASLAPHEVPVGRGGAALARRDHFAVGAETHRAAGFAPLKSRILEDSIEPFRLGLSLDQAGAGHHPGLHARVRRCGPSAIAAALRRSSMRLLVQEPMNTRSTLISASGVPGLQAHVGERPRHALSAFAPAASAGSGTRPSMGAASCGLVPQVTMGAISAASMRHFPVETASASDGRGAPARDRLDPTLRPGANGRPARYSIGDVVRRDHAGPRAGLDRHVADGQPAFHGEAADRGAGIFDDMAGGAGRADPGDDGQNEILGGDAAAERDRRA